ncbi:hypothetical protein BD413DRAFT_289274 [Trametes elegans]|nr:hypothetical protein BD413DRAFT_289274 [Trametes elegans]
MLGPLLLCSTFILGITSSVSAGLRGRPVRVRQHVPHDGQYIDASPQNNASEWWWAQISAPAEEGQAPPSLHVTFYQGYPLSAVRAASGGTDAVENYIVLNGAFPNGSVISYKLPATSSRVSHSGEAVSGTWPGAGSFQNSGDLSTFTVTLDAPAFAVHGTLEIRSSGPPHFGCNTTASPYFESAIPDGASLAPSEEILYKQVGWPTSQPGGGARIDVTLGDTRLQFAGEGYHDQWFMAQPMDAFLDDWYYLNAQVGPYDLSAVYAALKGAEREFTTGFLGQADAILQNQCGVRGARTSDVVTITPFGLAFDEPSGVNVMDGFTLAYTLRNGDEYRFNLTGQSIVLNRAFYHRWVGSAVGGKVGGTQYSGVSMYDWLNPGLRPYNG